MLALLFLIEGAMVIAGVTAPLDHHVLAALRAAPAQAVGADWLLPLAIGLTMIGAAIVRVPLAIGATLWLVARRRARDALALAGAVAIGLAILPLVKELIGRPRPDPAWWLVAASRESFPSGHATGAMLLYPLLGAIAGGRRAAVAGIVLALLIGLSRVYLGVHWASDVLGGWLLGGAGALAALALRRSRVDWQGPRA